MLLFYFQLEQLHSKEDCSSVLKDLADVGDSQSLPEGQSSQGQSPPTGTDSYIDLDPGTIIRIAQILRKLNTKTGSAMQTTSESHGTNFASSTSLVCIVCLTELSQCSILQGTVLLKHLGKS